MCFILIKNCALGRKSIANITSVIENKEILQLDQKFMLKNFVISIDTPMV